MKSVGKCSWCTKPKLPNKSLCEKCYTKRRENASSKNKEVWYVSGFSNKINVNSSVEIVSKKLKGKTYETVIREEGANKDSIKDLLKEMYNKKNDYEKIVCGAKHTKLQLSEDTIIATYRKIDKLVVRSKRLVDISMLRDVCILNLNSVKVCGYCTFQGVRTLDLSNTDIENVEPLKNVHTLYLENCRKVRNVSPLTNVHTLNIASTNVEDVSALTNVHSLNIRNTKVKNMSSLSRCHTLEFYIENNKGSFEHLKYVNTLFVLAYGPKDYFSKIPKLIGTRTLYLWSYIGSLSPFESVENLCILTSQFSDLFRLKKLKNLHIENSTNLDTKYDIDIIKNLNSLYIRNSRNKNIFDKDFVDSLMSIPDVTIFHEENCGIRIGTLFKEFDKDNNSHLSDTEIPSPHFPGVFIPKKSLDKEFKIRLKK